MTKVDNLFWNEYFRLYDVLNRVYPYRKLLRIVMDEMNLQPGKMVLDAGAGTGNLSVLVDRAGAVVVGLDSSEIGLNIFREKLPNSKVILHDLKHPIALPDNNFDYICCINTLFAVSKEYREKICKEFYRLLKPGGKIIMTNLTTGYRPIRIYIAHASEEVRQFGFWRAIINLADLIGPTLKMFHFNRRMRYESEGFDGLVFFSPHEQGILLRNTGFSGVSKDRSIFAKQAVLNTGFKV